MYKLKTMFIPLALTTSTSSSPSPLPSTTPLDDGITTVKHYIYVHTQKPRTNATTKKYYFNWQENIKCKSHCIYTSTCPYRCCPEVCGYCSRSNCYTQGSKIGFYARTSEEDLEGGIQRTYNSPFSWDTTSTECLTGVPPPSKPSPYFVTQPNYHNGQFHQYYPPENQSPLSLFPATSVHTTSLPTTGMNTTQTSVTSTTSLTSTTSTTPSTTAYCSSHVAVSREHRTLTLFAPIALVESLTKTNQLLVADMKGELQSMNNQLSNLPFNAFREEQNQNTESLKTRMEALEQGFMELREVVMQRTINNLKPNPELLEVWNSTMMVLQKSNWTNMRLILIKVAGDNYPDLFPSEWAHQKLFTQMHEMHYKVFSEVMTTLFHQCGILMDCNIFEIQNYELFLRALHHHLVMGTVNMTQVGHFLILMTYMSFCRLNHYTDYLSDRDRAMTEPALWMCLVIISFRSTFQMEGAHRTINSYFKVLPTRVRRRLHVIITRYMEQECSCQNHVQCDIFPSPLTTEIVTPQVISTSSNIFIRKVIQQREAVFQLNQEP